ncbi:hypothetical protein ROHU_003387 [Labeo rohita]|uniref:Retrovirus-related Pol poly from transposon n=1 Tax=Labeo rohita TaxID=84645 RepID=A0A498NW45_LABRO|nr:hypothetical protein ROHU_003387 [Labeo rohita]
MAVKAHAPQRVTRAHPVLFSEEEDTVEAVETVNTGEMELGAVGREVDSSLDHFPLAVNSQEEDTEPVALEAYAGMEELRAVNYDDIKAAVLAKYNVTEETYRLQFRSLMNENQVAMMVQAVDEELDEEEMEPVRHSEDIPGDHSHLSDQQQQQLVKKPYRVPEKMVEKLKTEVKMMLEMGIMEPSQSEWSSPILLFNHDSQKNLKFVKKKRKQKIKCF